MPDIPFTDSNDDHTVVDFASLSLYLVALYNLYVALFFF